MLKILVKKQKMRQVKKQAHKNHHLALVLPLVPKTQAFSGYLRFLETTLNVGLKDLKVVTRIGHS